MFIGPAPETAIGKRSVIKTASVVCSALILIWGNERSKSILNVESEKLMSLMTKFSFPWIKALRTSMLILQRKRNHDKKYDCDNECLIYSGYVRAN